VELLKKIVEELIVPPRCFITVGLPIDGEQTAVQDGEYCDKDETQQLHTFIKITRSKTNQSKYTFPAVLWIRIRLNPHYFGNLDPHPHPHQIKIRIPIRIRIK
jgi:hypothetical protein